MFLRVEKPAIEVDGDYVFVNAPSWLRKTFVHREFLQRQHLIACSNITIVHTSGILQVYESGISPGAKQIINIGGSMKDAGDTEFRW